MTTETMLMEVVNQLKIANRLYAYALLSHLSVDASDYRDIKAELQAILGEPV